MSSIKNITKTPTPEVAGQLLKVANDVALKYAQNYYWSTWRSWNAFRFGTGLFEDHLVVVSLIYAELCVELCLREDELGCEYAPTVELMCSTQATAFRVPLGGVFKMHSYIPISGPEGQERFKYYLEDGKYRLTMDSKHASYEPFQFFGLNGNKEMSRLAAIIEKDYDHEMVNGVLPASKHLSFRSLLEKKPQFIAAEPVDDKWLATTVRIRVDFAEPRIVMQISWADWPQSENLSLLLMDPTPKGFRLSATDKAMLLEQKLYAARDAEPKQELQGLAQLKMLGMEFGLSCEVFNGICRSVYRTWDPIRPKSLKSLADDEAHEALGYL
ncbi:hypothetical protein G6514_000630 [Epicoccum nigrum]|nr:hypothetical protein G6514_000630 [Epicoccum nigrum]